MTRMPSLSRIPDDLFHRLEEAPFRILAGSEYLPCRLVLTDGSVVEPAYVVRGKYFRYPRAPYHRDLNGFDWNSNTEEAARSVILTDIARVEPTPFALPPELVRKITASATQHDWEFRCMLLLSDGRRLPYIAAGLPDFPDLPPDITVADMVDVLPYDYKSPQSLIRGALKVSICYFPSHRERLLRDPQVHAGLRVPSNLVADLRRIEPTEDGRRPCRLTLKGGIVREHALAFPAEDSLFDVEADNIPMNQVVKIEASPDRVPAPISRKIGALPRMGKEECLMFALLFRDGRRLSFKLFYFRELLTLPKGYSHSEIADVIPLERFEETPLEGPDVLLCPYLIGEAS